MNTSTSVQEYLFKVLVVGNQGTGKTSLIKRYVHSHFPLNYKATIGVDFALKVLPIDEKTTVRIQFWDIAGQERYGNMCRVYYKDAFGAFVVYDVTRGSTFEDVKKWKADIDKKVLFPQTDQPIPCLLIANKIDLDPEGVEAQELDAFCRRYNFVGWYDTSAKTNHNVDTAVRALVDHILSLSHSDPEEDDEKIDLTSSERVETNNGKRCCNN